MRSAPTSSGLSTWMAMPVLIPGSTKIASTPKNFCTIAAITLLIGGTTDATIAPSRLTPPRSCCARMPYSSAVRSRAVASRHELTSSSPSKRPRTMFVFPASTTRTLDDMGAMLLRENDVARAHRDRLRAVAQQRASLFVDAVPGAADGALADDAGDAIARLVHAEAPPFLDDLVVLERPGKPRVDMLDEGDGRRVDAAERTRYRLADG